MQKAISKTRVHDGIIGAVVLLSIYLAVTVNIAWLWLPGVLAVLMISSSFTGFCPLYFILNKVMPTSD